ncbi:hypothetical protein [Clostridium sp. HBUAS56017]|uniref:hypothetical protein n=1 Tax=Clostridium sp. HBUAS56017 TaxID=2571128 RepID=UPI0011789DA8|nr:hypothetical protein [Clostridium sp. HBUAS56017]
MSNTIVLLANAYKEYDNKVRKRSGLNRRTSSPNSTNLNSGSKVSDYFKENKFLFFVLLILVISTVVYIISVLFLKKAIGTIISVLGYAISMFLLIYLSEKDDIKKYNYRRRKYYKKLDGFQRVIKYEFKLDSKEKIEYMIKECDETSRQLEHNNNFVQKFLDSWKNYIFPIITLGLGYVLKSDSANISWQTFSIGMISVFSIFIMIIGVLYSIQQVLDPITNSYKNRINTLRQILTDIYLKFYV